MNGLLGFTLFAIGAVMLWILSRMLSRPANGKLIREGLPRAAKMVRLSSESRAVENSRSMDKTEAKNYIYEARQTGVSNSEIAETLTKKGWQVHEILDIVLEPRAEDERDRDTAITVRNLSKYYGKLQALDSVSLDVPRGKVIALLGPNGAGKTTLVRILATLLLPDSGTATVLGLNVVRHAQRLRSLIGLAGQYAAVDESLTARENLEMVGRLYHLSKAEAEARGKELIKQFELEHAADRQVKTYSGGMRRRLDLAASLVIRPKVLFLDEPTTGLDPAGRFTLWQVIRQLAAAGTTILLTTQYMEEADQLAQKIFVIDHGKIIAEGTPNELKRQVGGDVLELHLTNREDAPRAADLIRSFGRGEPHIDAAGGVVTVPVGGGTAILVEAVRKFDEAGIKILDILLRRPSLDDVFMKLTGHQAEQK